MITADFFPETQCQHHRLDVVETPEGPHYAKEVCADCGRFIKWLPKPENLQKIKDTQDRLRILWKYHDLTAWEKQFLMSIEKAGCRCSPKQQAVLESIWSKYAGR